VDADTKPIILQSRSTGWQKASAVRGAPIAPEGVTRKVGGKEGPPFSQVRGPCFFERHPAAWDILAPRAAAPGGKLETQISNSRGVCEFLCNFGQAPHSQAAASGAVHEAHAKNSKTVEPDWKTQPHWFTNLNCR